MQWSKMEEIPHKSDEPVSKSMVTVCPPMLTGDRNSASPSSDVAITSELD